MDTQPKWESYTEIAMRQLREALSHATQEQLNALENAVINVYNKVQDIDYGACSSVGGLSLWEINECIHGDK